MSPSLYRISGFVCLRALGIILDLDDMLVVSEIVALLSSLRYFLIQD